MVLMPTFYPEMPGLNTVLEIGTSFPFPHQAKLDHTNLKHLDSLLIHEIISLKLMQCLSIFYNPRQDS